MESEYYSVHGHYGRENFTELSKRLGIVEARAQRIIDEFFLKQDRVRDLVGQSFLPGSLRKNYAHFLADKLREGC